MRSRRPSRPRSSAPHRKLLQLCAEVRRSLETSLAGDPHDDLLQELSIESVEPVDERRLHVLVGVHGKALDAGRQAVAQRLEAVRGRLLHDLAHSLSHRRKLPELVFELLPGGRPDPQ